jgi:hypothetical protein
MRDLRYEQFLNKSGVPWHYEEKIALSQVNEVESFKNQARYQAINDDVVTKYAIEMLDGVKFPALCAYRGKDKKLVIISGNHRFKAYKEAEISVADFYVVDTAVEHVLLRITFESNLLESPIPPTSEERYEQGITLYRLGIYTVEDTARALRLDRTTLDTKINARLMSERLTILGFKNARKLTQTSLVVLSRIKQDKALLKTASLAYEAQLSKEELLEVTDKVRDASNSEITQAHVVANLYMQYGDRLGTTAKGKYHIAQSTPRQRFIKNLNSLLDDAQKPESLAPYETVFVRKIQRAIDALTKVNRYGNPS